MYYPFLRGKQEELLAIKELLLAGKLGDRVTPVIELVKLSSTLVSTLAEFVKAERNIYLVMNPIVGEFENNMSETLLGNEDEDEVRRIKRLNLIKEKFNVLLTSEFVKIALYYCNDFNGYFNNSKLKSENEIAILLKDAGENMAFMQSSFIENNRIKLCFTTEIEDVINFTGRAVLWRDRFNKRERNSDYPEDEFFSKDHSIYSTQGCVGFSDYSIVDSEYVDNGFSPYAIAIHMVYEGNENKHLRIRHFISDTNNSPKNPSQKYKEATKKLVAWCEPNISLKTLGYSKIKDTHDKEAYPGLGSVKRFSIMHHLEITGEVLETL
ncbi:sce7725 family protein [Bacillus altitudinis]|uniref:sce7725 family protein n=1 Tax=Bacillus altitudinis TaxID=293387 RepID=UPI000681510B|nr:sce7725 family protein [Bacillus altitudinis]AKU31406.1 hypothetical protein ID12_08215 [Bacillus altitudinis]